MNEKKMREQIERISTEFARQLVELLIPEQGQTFTRYARSRDLEEEYSISPATVSRIVKLIKENSPDRYADDAVVDFGGKIRVRRDCFQDAFRYRYQIERGIAGRPNPELTKAY